ncbi:MAG: response regulator [Anaerolineae bacterium]
MSVTIFLADDHAVLRDGLRLLLEAQPDFSVVGEAANGRDAVRQVAQSGSAAPDVLIMDIAMPGLNGIEATRQVLEACPGVRVIILSVHSTLEHISQALQAGARGYLLKESAGVEVVNAARTVAAGGRYLSRKIPPDAIARYTRRSRAGDTHRLTARLSPREREVLQLVVEGKSSADIAAILHLSPKTVDTYRSRLMQKLELHNLPELVKFAIQHGLTPLE